MRQTMGMRHEVVVAVLAVASVAWAQSPKLLPTAPVAPAGAVAATGTARRPVSLKEALVLTAQNNLDLKAAQAVTRQVAAKAGLVYSAVMPDITLGANYVYTSAPQEFDTAAFSSGIARPIQALAEGIDWTKLSPESIAVLTTPAEPADPIVLVGRHSVYGQLVVSQVLFTPALFLWPSAGEAQEAARLGGLEAREQVLLAVARVYLGLQGLQQLEVAAREAEGVALRRETEAQARLGVGMVTEVNVLRAQSETAQARATLATLSGQRVALLAMLEALVGEAVQPLEGEASLGEVVALEESAQPWEATYALKAAAMGLTAQERFNLYDRMSWLPTLVAQGKGNYNSNQGFAGTNFTFDGILALQWQIFDKGQRIAATRENDAKTVEQRMRLESARARARATWVGARTNLAASRVALEQAQAQALLAGRAQKQVEAAYELGLTTALEVSDIDNKRFLAASAAAQARAQLEIRRVELAAAEGRLAELVGLTATGDGLGP